MPHVFITDPSARRRVLAYVAVVLALGIFFYASRGSTWQGSRELHTVMEAVATVLALLVGAMALVRFYSKKDSAILFVGAGFLGTGFLDGYHALVTSTAFAPYLPSDLPSLIPWSWVASRFFLSSLLFLSWLVWRWEKKSGSERIVPESFVYGFVAALIILSFLFFAVVPLPRAYYPEYGFGRPEELVPGAIFLFAAIGYFKKGLWKRDVLEHWLLLALIVSVVSEVAFMSLSFGLFDFAFDAAHFLKQITYVLVLVGLLFSVYAPFKGAESVASRLRLLVEKHQQAELEARRSKDSLQSIFNAVPDGIITTDTAGAIKTFNPGAERIFGYESGEVKNKNIKILMPDDFSIDHDDHMAKYRAGKGALAIGARRDLKGMRKDGAIFSMDLTINNIGGDGGAGAITGVVRDITPEKMAAEDLKKSNEDLEQFAYVASHDLKAPLRGINILASFIREDLGGDLEEKVEANFSLLQSRIKRMEKLLDDLLEYARVGKGKIQQEHVSLKRTIADVVALLALPDGFDVRVNCAEINLNIARASLDQVLMNLIGNAVKHHDRETGKVSVDAYVSAGILTLSIEDDGPGIPEKFHGRVFKMFQTLQPRDKVEGSGVGLTVVKKVIESYGGSIQIFSTDNARGTRFLIRWPAGVEEGDDA